MNRSLLESFCRLAPAATLWAMLSGVPAAQAQLTLWGTFASGSATDVECTGSPDCHSVEVIERSGTLTVSADMSEGAKTAHPGVDFRAQATLSGGLALPELRALAAAGTSERYGVLSTAEAIQGYSYAGSGTTAYVLDIFLDAELSGRGSVSGQVDIYDAAGFDPRDEEIGTRLARTSFNWSVAGPNNQPAPLSFALEPGDQIYLYAVLQAYAPSPPGSLANAYNTLTMSFMDPTGLTPASAVPEPGPAAMLGLGLAWLWWFNRSRRRRGVAGS